MHANNPALAPSSSAARGSAELTEAKESLTLQEKLLEKILTSPAKRARGIVNPPSYRQAALELVVEGDLEALKLLLGNAHAPLPDNPNFLMLSFLIAYKIEDFEYRLLREAVRTGQLAVVRYFIEELRLDGKTLDKNNRSLPYIAAAEGQLHVLRYLIKECGLPLSYQEPNYKNPSIINIILERSHIQVLAYLLELAAVTSKNEQDEVKPSTAVEQATRLVQLCQNAGGATNMLWQAVLAEDVDTLRLLHKIKLPQNHGCSPLHGYATLVDIQRALAEWIALPDAEHTRNFRRVCQNVAGKFSQTYYSIDRISQILEQEHHLLGLKVEHLSLFTIDRHAYHHTLIDIAVNENKSRSLDFLINEAGFKLSEMRQKNYSLHKCARLGQADILHILLSHEEKYRPLHRISHLRHPHFTDRTDHQGSNVLLAAAEGGHTQLVQNLIDKRRDLPESKELSPFAINLVNLCRGKQAVDVLDAAVRAGDLGTVEFLDSAGLSVDKTETAVVSGHINVVNYYLFHFDLLRTGEHRKLDRDHLLSLIITAASAGHAKAVETLLTAYKSACLQKDNANEDKKVEIIDDGISRLKGPTSIRVLAQADKHIYIDTLPFPDDTIPVLAQNLLRLCHSHQSRSEILSTAASHGAIVDLRFLYAIGMGERIVSSGEYVAIRNEGLTKSVIEAAIRANQLAVVQFFLEEFIYQPSWLKERCLHWCDMACQLGHIELLAYLLKVHTDTLKLQILPDILYENNIPQIEVSGKLMRALQRKDKAAVELIISSMNFRAEETAAVSDLLLAIWADLCNDLDFLDIAQQFVKATAGRSIGATLNAAIVEDDVATLQIFHQLNIEGSHFPEEINNPILIATQNGRVQVLNVLLGDSSPEAGDSSPEPDNSRPKQDLIYVAAKAAQQGCIELLLSKYQNIYIAVKNCLHKHGQLSAAEHANSVINPKLLADIARRLIGLYASKNKPAQAVHDAEEKPAAIPEQEENYEDPFLTAAQNGDLLGIELLEVIRAHEKLNQRSHIIAAAVKHNHLNIVQHYLQQKGIYVAIRSWLHIATVEGHPAMLEFLFQYADERAGENSDDYYQGEVSFDPDYRHEAKADEAYSLLHLAASQGRLPIVRFIVDRYFELKEIFHKLTMLDRGGRTPALAALEAGHTEVAAYLYLALLDAIELRSAGNTDNTESLEVEHEVENAAALQYDFEEQAAGEGEESKEEIVEEEPIDPEVLAQFQPLAKLCHERKDYYSAFLHCIITGQLDNVKLLVKLGVNPSRIKQGEKSALLTAIQHARLATVRYLAEEFREPDVQEDKEKASMGSALIYAQNAFRAGVAIDNEEVIAIRGDIVAYLHQRYFGLFYTAYLPPASGPNYQAELPKWLHKIASNDDVDALDHFNRHHLLPEHLPLVDEDKTASPLIMGATHRHDMPLGILLYLLSQGVTSENIAKGLIAKGLRGGALTPAETMLKTLFLEPSENGDLNNANLLIKYSEKTKYAAGLSKLLALALSHHLLNQENLVKTLECRGNTEVIRLYINHLAQLTEPTVAHFNSILHHRDKAFQTLESRVTLPLSPYADQYRNARNFARLYHLNQRPTTPQDASPAPLQHAKQESPFSTLIPVLAQSIASFLAPNGNKLFDTYNRFTTINPHFPSGLFSAEKNSRQNEDEYDNKKEEYDNDFGW